MAVNYHPIFPIIKPKNNQIAGTINIAQCILAVATIFSFGEMAR